MGRRTQGRIWDFQGQTESLIETQMWIEARLHKGKHYTQTPVLLSPLILISLLCAQCADKVQYVWPLSPDTVKVICGERKKVWKGTRSQLHTQSHTLCQTGITFPHEWITFITTDPQRAKQRAKVWAEGEKRAVWSLLLLSLSLCYVSRDVPLLF